MLSQVPTDIGGRAAAVVATGTYLPPEELPNTWFRERFREVKADFVDKMEAASGILTRFRAPEDWATSDLAVPAFRAALARAELSADDVDLIVVGTDSPDHITPSTSVVVQHKLGARRAGTFDVVSACASFPTGLAAAAGLMRMNPALRNVLVGGAYMMSKLSDPDDLMGYFYGDGAGAVLLQPSEAPGVFGAAFQADGAFARHWCVPAGGTAEPVTPEAISEGRHQVRMLERFPPEINDLGWPRLVRKLAREQGFSLDEVDLFIFTQVRSTTIEKVMAALEQPLEKTHLVMQKFGYTGSACVPMALHDASAQGRLSPGQLVVLVGSGVGYNQAATALRLTEAFLG
ncbi:MAG: ketoacyl-ACP synthase III [Myxococcota bacterium]